MATKPRARANKKKSATNPAASLIAALKFVSIAQKKVGPPGFQFCMATNNWLVASNGVLTAAHPIQEDLEACPHTIQLLDALSNVEDELSITQLSANCLAVTSGVFRALVPCVEPDALSIPEPDPEIAVIDDRVKTALANASYLATEGAPIAAYASVLLQAQTCVATNGTALAEAFHGNDLPPDLLMPKNSALAIAKSPYALKGFGFSQSSATFYFEGGALIKTQLFNEKYPNYQMLFLNCNYENYKELPSDFFKALAAIEPFASEGIVHFDNGSILSESNKDIASSYQIIGLPERMSFKIETLMELKHVLSGKVYFNKEMNRLEFFNEGVRGMVSSVVLKSSDDLNSEDIPF